MSQPTSETPDRVLLECIGGPDLGRALLVTVTPLAFGKGRNAQFSSNDPLVSQHHAMFYVRAGVLWVEAAPDAKVVVEGRYATTSPVRPSDRIKMGDSYWQQRPIPSPPEAGGLFEAISSRVGETVGLGKLDRFSFAELFSEVFRRHSSDEAESLLAAGTSRTTPSLDLVEGGWPKPWLFVRMALLSLAACLLFIIGGLVWDNTKFIPGLIITGSAMVPAALLVLFMEMNAPRNVSSFRLAQVVVVAGGISLVLAMLMFQIPWSSTFLWGPMVAGPAEELAKLGAVLTVVWIAKYRWTLNGLLLGAAVGAGFSAFETAGYAFDKLVTDLVAGAAAFIRANPNVLGLSDADYFNVVLSQVFGNVEPSGMLFTLAIRAFTSIGGLHVAWTAMVGAALWKARGDRPFRITLLLHPYFLRTLFIAMALHALWNMPIPVPDTLQWGLLGAKFLVIGGISWSIVLVYANDGMRQVRKAKAEWLASQKGTAPANPSGYEGSMVWR